MNQHYTTLGLQEGASQEEIEAAYKRLSKELDPANNDNQEFFIEEYKKLQQAYKALSASSILATKQGAKQIVKKPNSSSKNKNDSVKPIEDKLNTPKKKNVSHDILLLFIAIGVSVLLLQNFGFFDYIQNEYQRNNMSVLQRRAQDLKELTKEEQLDLMWDFGASEEELEKYKERRIFWIMGSYQEAYKILALQEGATLEQIKEAIVNPARPKGTKNLSIAIYILEHLAKPIRLDSIDQQPVPLWRYKRYPQY